MLPWVVKQYPEKLISCLQSLGPLWIGPTLLSLKHHCPGMTLWKPVAWLNNRVIPNHHSSEPKKHPPKCITSSSCSFCSSKFHRLAPQAVQMCLPLSAVQQGEGEAPREYLALPHLLYFTDPPRASTGDRTWLKGTFLLWRGFLPLALVNSPSPTSLARFISQSPSEGIRWRQDGLWHHSVR